LIPTTLFYEKKLFRKNIDFLIPHHHQLCGSATLAKLPTWWIATSIEQPTWQKCCVHKNYYGGGLPRQ